MAGLIEMGRGHRREAMQGLRDVAQMEKARERTNEQLETAQKASRANSMGSGAVIGGQLGHQYLASKPLSALVGKSAATTAATTAAESVAAGAVAGAGEGAKAGAMGGPMGMALGAIAGLAMGYFLS